MTQEFVIALGKNALSTAFIVAAPMLLTGLVVGLIIGVFQAVTQIQEMTLTFIPKILVVVLTLFLFLPWMLNVLISFATNVFNSISTVAH
ncbi:MAG TPA: flagellar biosynthesis protein FliQ [Bacteroidetes bacterium]|nr:flagellar biosynthesis protein FliQ [Bacteroidota bacterium]